MTIGNILVILLFTIYSCVYLATLTEVRFMKDRIDFINKQYIDIYKLFRMVDEQYELLETQHDDVMRSYDLIYKLYKNEHHDPE